MERRSGKYFGAETALRQISLATAGTLTLKRSGKLPPNRGIWHQKSPKIFPGVTPRIPSAGGGDSSATPSRTHPQHGYTPCAGAQAAPLLGRRSRKPSPKSKFTTRGALSDAAIRPYVRLCVCPSVCPTWPRCAARRPARRTSPTPGQQRCADCRSVHARLG